MLTKPILNQFPQGLSHTQSLLELTELVKILAQVKVHPLTVSINTELYVPPTLVFPHSFQRMT